MNEVQWLLCLEELISALQVRKYIYPLLLVYVQYFDMGLNMDTCHIIQHTGIKNALVDTVGLWNVI